jgi:hypothetical protein
MTASDWLMHGLFQGIDENLAYTRFVIPLTEDRPPSHKNLPSPVWMTQQRALQKRAYRKGLRANAVAR